MDNADAVETGDQMARLQSFFEKRCEDPDRVRVVGYEPVTGGWSRATARVWVEEAGIRRGYVVRSDPPPGQSVLDTDRSEEWRLLSALTKVGTCPVPSALWFDDDGAELGSPAIVMELIEGETLLARARAADPAEHLALAEPLADLAGAIHGFDLEALPEEMPVPASWDDYIDGCIQHWRDVERSHVEPEPMMRLVACWLEANRPPPVPLTLVHGDFHPANVLVDEASGDYRMVDWEAAHIGDPREDLGWMALAAVTQPPDLISADPDAFLARYRAITGLPEDALNPATLPYFMLLGAGSVFLGVTRQLLPVSRGETTAINATYISNVMAGINNVFLTAMTTLQGPR